MKIDIFDQTYNLSAEQDAEYLEKVAAYVDAKMRAVADASHTVDTVKVAVLAAVNIADELLTLREHQEQLEGPLRKRVEKCVGMVEKALERSN